MKVPIILCLCAVVSNYAVAQDKFGSGYYVTDSPDTVRGLIQYAPKYTRGFAFRSTAKSTTQRFTTDGVKAFGFTAGANFVRIDYAKEKGLPPAPIFVNVLMAGDIDLMIYQRTYLIGSEQKGRFELVDAKTSSETQAMKNYQANTGAFNILFQDCPAVKETAQKVAIRQKPLIDLLEAYHLCRDLPYKVIRTNKTRSAHQFGFFAGESFSTLSYGKSTTFVKSSYLYNTKFGKSAQPTFGLIALFAGRQPSPMLALQSELVYSKANFTGTYIYVNEDLANYYIKQTTVTTLEYSRLALRGGLRITARASTLHPYFSLGAAAQTFFAIHSHVHQVTEINVSIEDEDSELSIDKGSFAVWTAAGLKMMISGNKALFVDANYENSYISNSGRIEGVAVRIGFMF